jgi:hypothetical protein
MDLPTWTTEETSSTTYDEVKSTVPIFALAANGKQPKINGLKKSVSGSLNNYSSTNKGGSGPGKSSSGGSSKKNNKPKDYKKEPDLYHEIDAQIKLITNDLKDLQKIQDKVFGTAKIENLNKQYALLDQQVQKMNEKLGIANKEYQDLRDKLEAKGVTFEEDGLINNYNEAIAAEVKKYNDLQDQYYHLSDSEKEK